MRILWLTIDRSPKVMNHFDDFQQGVAKLADVTFVRRNVGANAFKYGVKTILQGRGVVSYDFSWRGYDFVMCDAFFAYASLEWARITVPKGILFEDVHGLITRKLFDMAISYGTDVVFCRYLYPTREMYEGRTKVRRLGGQRPRLLGPGFRRGLRRHS